MFLTFYDLHLMFNFGVDNDKGYTTLHEEAVRIFTALQGSLESIPDPLPIIQVFNLFCLQSWIYESCKNKGIGVCL